MALSDDDASARSRAVSWLRLVKLLLSILVLAIGLVEALGRLGAL